MIKNMMLVYWSLAVGQLVAGGVSYFVVSNGLLGEPDYTLAIMFQKIALIVVPALMAAGYFIFRYRLGKIDLKQSLETKIQKYFSVVIVRGALFEAAFLYCCVSALATSVKLFLYMAPIVFLVFLMLRPSRETIINDLQLSPAESAKIRQE